MAEQTTKRGAVNSSWSSAFSFSVFMSSSTYHSLTSRTRKWSGGSRKLSMLTSNIPIGINNLNVVKISIHLTVGSLKLRTRDMHVQIVYPMHSSVQ